ncbi:MAG: hypothetical protein KDA42_14500, partial [Planctomycetales bacterium]|nr:hypothetical protein [Planctomycetales bacterium]
LTISNATFTGNAAGDDGGVLANMGVGANSTFTSVTMATNSSADDGGAIFNDNFATVTLVESTLSGNSAAARGGAIINQRDAILVIERSTISGNQALGSEGGAIFNPTRGDITLVGSTISGNTAATRGGGIRINSGTLQVISSTIVNNTADTGGGIQQSGSSTTATVQNSVIAGNAGLTRNPDTQGTFVSLGHNFVGNQGSANGFTSQGDQAGSNGSPLNPLLGPLQDNGGATLTHAPLAGSPLLDQGIAAGLATDQRGLARTSDDGGISNAAGGDGSDIGAVELSVVAPPPLAMGASSPAPPAELDQSAIAAALAEWNDENDTLDETIDAIVDTQETEQDETVFDAIFGS